MIQPHLVRNHCSPIESLPNEIVAEIIERMIPTHPDGLSMALETIKNFAQTSKRMRSVVNSDYVKDVIIYSILIKQHSIPTHLFIKLNIFSLEKYIRKNRWDRAFKLTSKIHSIVLESLREVESVLQHERVLFTCSISPRCYLARPRDFLVMCDFYSPVRIIEVIHPFGQMVLSPKRGSALGKVDICVAAMLAEAVVNRLNASFQGIRTMGVHSRLDDAFTLVELPSSCRYLTVLRHRRDHNRIRQVSQGDIELISWRDMKSKKGGQQIIFASTMFAFSCYKIDQVCGEKLPHIRCRDNRLMHIVSEMLHFASSLNADSSALDECVRKEHMNTHLKQVIADMLEDTLIVSPLWYLKTDEDEDGAMTKESAATKDEGGSSTDEDEFV